MSDQKPSPETLLAAALEISEASERRAYLDRACGGDAALRQEVESLLEANAAAGEFLLHPAAVAADAAPKEQIPMGSNHSMKWHNFLTAAAAALVLTACSTARQDAPNALVTAQDWLGQRKSASLGTRFAQESAGWAGAKVTITDLLKGEPKHGKFAYFQTAVATRAGCHVAKVEGERGKEVFARRDGQRGKAYEDIAHPVFSPDGSALAYAVRGVGDSRFIVNEREGPKFEEVVPDTFVFSNDGKRHAYLARKAGSLVVVVDGVLQAEAGGDMVPWLQPPLFSADGSSVGYLEGSRLRRKMRVVVNGKPGEIFDGVDPQSLRFSPDGRRCSYAANDLSTGSSWFCVIDGQQRSAFDELGVSFAFSPDGKQFAYRAKRAGQRFLVVDGESELPVDGIADHSITFSPDSRRMAYVVVKPDRRAYLVLDDKAGPVYDGIMGLPPSVVVNRTSTQAANGLGSASLVLSTSLILFSPDSRRLAYVARSGQTFRVYLDGKADDVEMGSLVGGMVFSDDSKRLVYGGRRGNKFFLVVDGKEGADYDGIGYFGFSQDGQHIAFTAKKGDKMVIVVDGQERAEYSEVPAGPVFRSDGVLEFLATDQTSLYQIEVRDL